MGLSNIKKNSDRFVIQSTVGLGTRVRFTVYLKSQAASGAPGNSLRVSDGSCTGCLYCLHACPTKALRVRENKPEILDESCIDCTACIGVCRPGALTMYRTADMSKSSKETCLVVPTSFLAQFGAGVSPQRVLAALKAMGFYEVVVTDGWEDALRAAVAEYAQTEAVERPVISPVCEAVVNLIEMRFPSLIGNLAPFLSPMEAIQQELPAPHKLFVAACPCQRTALISKRSSFEVVSPSFLRNAVMPLLRADSDEVEKTPEQPNTSAPEPTGVLQVSGIRPVMRVLEDVENGLASDIHVLEPYACDHGCFGSPLLGENPSLARQRWLQTSSKHDTSATAVRRKALFLARVGMRLDSDMSKAIAKLSKIDELTRGLPGKDCGMCGAPTCASLAEDVVLGRIRKLVCTHLASGEEKPK
jgi:Na+-translocating ferredoxin:NAD+ oxidoreductase RNF subunit RnfB